MTSAIDFGGLGLSHSAAPEKPRNELGQAEFLALMTSQLENQDPLNPMENAEFMGQIAQFSTVEGIGNLNESFSNLASAMQSSQALQASALVGRDALINSPVAQLRNGSLSGAVNLPSGSADVAVEIINGRGQLVGQLELGNLPAGQHAFSWNGQGPDGEQLPDGTYYLQARGTVGSSTQAMQTLVNGRVDSVSFQGSQGLVLNVDGVGAVKLSDINRIS